MNEGRFIKFVEEIPQIETLKDGDLIEVFGYYCDVIENNPFNAKMLEGCFIVAVLSVPTNISSRLIELEKKSRVVKSNGNYKIERINRKRIEFEMLKKPKLKQISLSLEKLPSQLQQPESNYVSEAINCLKIEAYHAAIVLMWTTTMSHLRNYVISYKQQEFNSALANHTRYNKKQLQISKFEDFEEIKERDYLDLMKSSNVITSSQHKLLCEKLDIRNMFAHPTTLTLTENKTISFIEDLINDIITKIK